MKNKYVLLILILTCFTNISIAQLVGSDIYMQGNFLEAAQTNNGSLGTCSTPPSGYHPHSGFGTGMAQVYDWGHDGWTVGTPPLMGDYTNPGFPFEGWSLEVNGATNDAYQSCAGTITCCSFFPSTAGTLTGGSAGWASSGGRAVGNWSGTAAGGNLVIKQETRIDANASWILFTVKLYNISGSALNNIYYERTCDPDNTSTWGGVVGYTGGTSSTQNEITYQNDPQHRVMVSSWGNFGSFNKTNSYMGLGTKDCRAVCTFFDNNNGTAGFGGLSPSISPADIWNRVTTSINYPYGLGTTNYADEGYGLVFNIGTICANDSAVISFAYIFNNPAGIDSAFPDPMFSLNYRAPVDTSVRDTFDACLYPTIDSIPLTVPFGDERSWSFSSWTWAPSTGLSATTGTSIWAHVNAIPGVVTYTLTGTDSFGGCNNNSCLGKRQFFFTLKSCHAAWGLNACYGSSIYLGMSGDSLGATYKWTGPNGFTSTLHRPIIYPALYVDSGIYYVIKTIGAIHDTDSTRIIVYTKPVISVTDNSPMCANQLDTLHLSVTPLLPGETFAWTGPNTFTSAMQFPVINNFSPPDTGTYTVIATTPFGCSDTGAVFAGLVPPPAPPIITGDTVYCQNETFKGVTATVVPAGAGTVRWYSSLVGGTPSTVSPVLSTTAAGFQTVYASVISTFGCESTRASLRIKVTHTPPAPTVSGGIVDYCQGIGTFTPVTVNPVGPLSIVNWWTTASGGSRLAAQPFVDITIPGTYNSWVSQTDTGCESPRTPVVVMVHPKPAPPVVNSDSICQFFPHAAMTATLSNPADQIRWFIGATDTVGNITAPVPITLVPGLFEYYANELSVFGCLSDKGRGAVYVKPKPSAPLTRDTTYCQFDNVLPLTADSVYGGYLKWYINGAAQPIAPTPHNTLPGDSTYYVSEIMDGCESDSTALKVTVIYKPLFSILPGNTYVCQFDSVRFAYNGPALYQPQYTWTLPPDATYAHTSDNSVSVPGDSVIYVRFDSVTANNYIRLHVSDNNGFCASDTSYRIKIVPQPLGTANTKGNVCQGDTVILALGTKSASAQKFSWSVDGVPLDQTTALSIVAHNSNSGGPFSISWSDSGHHIIQVTSSSVEGCTSLPTEDTINVHVKPDAAFTYLTKTGTLCLEDSVLFTARNTDYNNSYLWTPEHFFSNVNQREIYGKVELSQSTITLLVTDPYGCTATTSQDIFPSSCCTVSFPSAFTPNGDGHGDYFRPIFVGYHRFSEFRIVNRWGQTVFESANSDMRWDGNYNGVPQDIGVYFYYVKFDCGGKSVEEHGDVTLIR